MKKTLIILLTLVSLPVLSHAQQWSVGTNLLGYANMGTLNLEASASVARHLSVTASTDVNPWTFHPGDPDRQKQNRNQSYAAGVRWWPWYVYSGWWASAKLRYQEYNRGGWRGRATEEGDAFGASLGAGYTLMLRDNVNLELGAGFWGGRKVYTAYACPTCGRVTGEGGKWFLMPNDIMLSLVFVF